MSGRGKYLCSISLPSVFSIFIITLISGRHRGHRNQQNAHQQPTLTSVARETAASFAPDSPVLAMFREAAVQLNNRQDRHERLVKLSRDITIESKRIIFLLHSAIRFVRISTQFSVETGLFIENILFDWCSNPSLSVR